MAVVRGAIAQGFGQVLSGHDIRVIEIRNGPGDPQHAVVGTRRECEAIGGAYEKGAGIGFEPGGGSDEARRRGRVGERGGARVRGRREVCVAQSLSFAGGDHPLAYGRRTFRRGLQGQGFGWHTPHVHMQIDAVGQWTGKPCAMAFEFGDGAAA